MAKNDPPSSTVAYITLITRVFWPFLGGVIIFIKNMTMLHFSWKFHFHEKWDGRWFSSHDEGPASTARFTGGQVIRECIRHHKNELLFSCFSYLFLVTCLACVFRYDLPPCKTSGRGRTLDMRRIPPPMYFLTKIPHIVEKPSLRVFDHFQPNIAQKYPKNG